MSSHDRASVGAPRTPTEHETRLHDEYAARGAVWHALGEDYRVDVHRAVSDAYANHIDADGGVPQQHLYASTSCLHVLRDAKRYKGLVRALHKHARANGPNVNDLCLTIAALYASTDGDLPTDCAVAESWLPAYETVADNLQRAWHETQGDIYACRCSVVSRDATSSATYAPLAFRAYTKALECAPTPPGTRTVYGSHVPSDAEQRARLNRKCGALWLHYGHYLASTPTPGTQVASGGGDGGGSSSSDAYVRTAQTFLEEADRCAGTGQGLHVLARAHDYGRGHATHDDITARRYYTRAHEKGFHEDTALSAGDVTDRYFTRANQEAAAQYYADILTHSTSVDHRYKALHRLCSIRALPDALQPTSHEGTYMERAMQMGHYGSMAEYAWRLYVGAELAIPTDDAGGRRVWKYPRNWTEAKYLYEVAAKAGVARAMYMLSVLYAQDGDERASWRWLLHAARHGDRDAVRSLLEAKRTPPDSVWSRSGSGSEQ